MDQRAESGAHGRGDKAENAADVQAADASGAAEGEASALEPEDGEAQQVQVREGASGKEVAAAAAAVEGEAEIPEQLWVRGCEGRAALNGARFMRTREFEVC